MLILRARCSFAFHSLHCFVFASLPLLVPAADAAAQPDPSGIEFITIGSPGNAPWPGNGTPGDRAVGRGGVNYEYRIGKYEVTTAQYVEFMNAAFDRPANDRLPHLFPPTFWGAAGTTPTTPGGLRWRVPAGNEMMPVGDISWRMAAMYCNFLHNGGSGSGGIVPRQNFLDGAYSVSTFGFTPGGRFTDQLTHSPGARYWIPTWDESLKANHYDPNKLNGDGTRGGWWVYSNGSDTPYVYGPPGVLVNGVLAQANASWDDRQFPGFNPFAVPLGAYSMVTTPWGLFDAAGGTGEWTEEAFFPVPGELFPSDRLYEGSQRETPTQFADMVRAFGGSAFPSYFDYSIGVRVASAVPAPGVCSLGIGFAFLSMYRRRRSHEKDSMVVDSGKRSGW